jgi:hypothetical protein
MFVLCRYILLTASMMQVSVLSFKRIINEKLSLNSRIFCIVTTFKEINNELKLKNQHDEWIRNCVSELDNAEVLTNIVLESKVTSSEGSIAGNKKIQFNCQAYSSQHLEYVRVAQLTGPQYHIFNIVAFPKTDFELPILGIDVVRLPGIFYCFYVVILFCQKIMLVHQSKNY